MTLGVKNDDTYLSVEDDIEELKFEVKIAESLVAKAIAKGRAAIAVDPSPKAIAALRAAASIMKETAERASKAFKVLRRVKDLSEEARKAQEAKQLDLEASYIECKFEIEAYLREHDPDATGDESRKNSDSIQNESKRQPLNSTMNPQPPKMSWKEILQRVPKFAGDPTKFRRWKDAFILYVDSTAMDPLEKFQLMLKTVVGRVPESIAIWDVSADKYEDARNAIFERYGNIVKAEDRHVDNFIDACRKKDINTDGKFIEFVNVVSHSLGAIVNLGNTYEGMSVLGTRIVMSALTFERRQRFDDTYDPDVTPCRLKALLDFLNCERDQLERLSERQKTSFKPNSELKKSHFGQQSSYEKANQFKRFGERKFNPAGPTGSESSQYSFTAVTPERKQQVDHACIFCQGQHSSGQCKKDMSIDERRKCVATKNACYKCLGRNHRVDKCKAKGCARCKGRHHVLLCTKPEVATSASLTAKDCVDSCDNTVKITNVAERILPTGYVKVIGDDRVSISRVMLDTGSQNANLASRRRN